MVTEIFVLDKEADTGRHKNKREDKRNVFSIKKKKKSSSGSIHWQSALNAKIFF